MALEAARMLESDGGPAFQRVRSLARRAGWPAMTTWPAMPALRASAPMTPRRHTVCLAYGLRGQSTCVASTAAAVLADHCHLPVPRSRSGQPAAVVPAAADPGAGHPRRAGWRHRPPARSAEGTHRHRLRWSVLRRRRLTLSCRSPCVIRNKGAGGRAVARYCHWLSPVQGNRPTAGSAVQGSCRLTRSRRR